MGQRTCVLLAILAAGVSDAGAGSRTSITVWAATPPSANMFGGAMYGGYQAPTGAVITERRQVDLDGGELKITGVAATADAASVQMRSLTDPGGLTITEQRFVPGATSPDEILARHVGETVSVVTTKGELTGVLRSVDPQTLVLEMGAGDQHRLQVMRRDGYVQDVKLSGGGIDKPTLAWRVATKKKGKHDVEVTYRAEGLSWTPDYLAIFDEAARTLDFSAWATIKNLTGATFDNAELTLVSGGPNVAPAQQNPYAMLPARPAPPQIQFPVATPIRIGQGESVQVELLAPRVGVRSRSVVTYEAVPDLSQLQAYVASDCTQQNLGIGGAGRAEIALELELPPSVQLPEGRVRLFKRKGDRLEIASEDQLRASPGLARMRLATDTEIAGERRQVSCNTDERARTIHEKIEVKIENKGKQAADVVVRELMWRSPMWRIDPAEETVKGVRAGAQTQEYRLTVPAGAKKSVAYTVAYTW